MLSSIKQLIAGTTSRYAPSLFYFAAGAAERKDVRIEAGRDRIDIVNDRTGKIIRIGRQHAIYVVDLIECFDYYHASVASSPQGEDGRYALVDFSRQAPHQVAGFDDFPIVFSGLPEPMVTANQYLEFAALEQGGVVLDLGAYSALTSIVFGKAVGARGTVLAFEPDPVSHETARLNVTAYETHCGMRNIELVQAAVMGKTGRLKLSAEGTLGSAAATLVGGHRGKVVEVEGWSLDDLAARYSLERVDFVKIDIEGSEEEVVASAGDFFRRYRPKVIVEPHFVSGLCSDAAVRQLLTGYGYACDTIPQTGIDALPLITATPLGSA